MMSSIQVPYFICKDNKPKTHSLLCDGGKHGTYRLLFCNACYDTEEKRFVISEDLL